MNSCIPQNMSWQVLSKTSLLQRQKVLHTSGSGGSPGGIPGRKPMGGCFGCVKAELSLFFFFPPQIKHAFCKDKQMRVSVSRVSYFSVMQIFKFKLLYQCHMQHIDLYCLLVFVAHSIANSSVPCTHVSQHSKVPGLKRRTLNGFFDLCEDDQDGSTSICDKPNGKPDGWLPDPGFFAVVAFLDVGELHSWRCTCVTTWMGNSHAQLELKLCQVNGKGGKWPDT